MGGKGRGMSGKVYDRLVFYAGDEVFAEGEEANWAYLIQKGEVEIVKDRPDGKTERLAVLGPGRLFGEMALIDDHPRMASARAVTDCVLVLINTEMLSGKISKCDPLLRELIHNFTINLREMGRLHVAHKAAETARKG